MLRIIQVSSHRICPVASEAAREGIFRLNSFSGRYEISSGGFADLPGSLPGHRQTLRRRGVR